MLVQLRASIAAPAGALSSIEVPGVRSETRHAATAHCLQRRIVHHGLHCLVERRIVLLDIPGQGADGLILEDFIKKFDTVGVDKLLPERVLDNVREHEDKETHLDAGMDDADTPHLFVVRVR